MTDIKRIQIQHESFDALRRGYRRMRSIFAIEYCKKKKRKNRFSFAFYIYIQMHTREGKMAIDKNNRYKKKDCTLE